MFMHNFFLKLCKNDLSYPTHNLAELSTAEEILNKIYHAKARFMASSACL